jgi:hypothetical protein
MYVIVHFPSNTNTKFFTMYCIYLRETNKNIHIVECKYIQKMMKLEKILSKEKIQECPLQIIFKTYRELEILSQKSKHQI